MAGGGGWGIHANSCQRDIIFCCHGIFNVRRPVVNGNSVFRLLRKTRKGWVGGGGGGEGERCIRMLP